MEALYLDNCAVHKHIGFWCLCIPTECFVVRWILILFGEESCDIDTSFVCLFVFGGAAIEVLRLIFVYSTKDPLHTMNNWLQAWDY